MSNCLRYYLPYEFCSYQNFALLWHAVDKFRSDSRPNAGMAGHSYVSMSHYFGTGYILCRLSTARRAATSGRWIDVNLLPIVCGRERDTAAQLSASRCRVQPSAVSGPGTDQRILARPHRFGCMDLSERMPPFLVGIGTRPTRRSSSRPPGRIRLGAFPAPCLPTIYLTRGKRPAAPALTGPGTAGTSPSIWSPRSSATPIR